MGFRLHIDAARATLRLGGSVILDTSVDGQRFILEVEKDRHVVPEGLLIKFMHWCTENGLSFSWTTDIEAKLKDDPARHAFKMHALSSMRHDAQLLMRSRK